MANQERTVGEIRRAQSQAVGGGRKRCRKGKNCSAACIQSGMVCLVEMPESAGIATTRVRNALWKKLGDEKYRTESRKDWANALNKKAQAQKSLAQKKDLAIKEKAKANLQKAFEKDKQPKGPLTGEALIDKVKSMGDASKSDIARAAGYVSKTSNGAEKIDFTKFYEALIAAKNLKSEANPKTQKINAETDKKELRKIEKAAEKLDSYDKNIIKDYTNMGAQRINTALRDGPEVDLDAYKRALEEADDIVSVLSQLPGNGVRKTYFRGLQFNPLYDEYSADRWKEFASLTPGDTLTDPGFSSYSSSRRIAKSFYENEDQVYRVLLVSKNPGITPIYPLSSSPEEKEGLLEFDAEQTVSWVKKGRNNTVIIGLDYD